MREPKREEQVLVSAKRGLNEWDHLRLPRPADRHFPILKQCAISAWFRDGLKTIKVKKPGLASRCCEITAYAPAFFERPGHDQLSNRIESLMAIGMHSDEARADRHHSKSDPVADARARTVFREIIGERRIITGDHED